MYHVCHRKRRLRRHRAADHLFRYVWCREGSPEEMASWYRGGVFVRAQRYRSDAQGRWWARILRMRWQRWEEEGWQRTEVGWKGRSRAGEVPARLILSCLGMQWVVLRSLRTTGAVVRRSVQPAGTSHELIPWHRQ
jgi:hypothetical protein